MQALKTSSRVFISTFVLGIFSFFVSGCAVQFEPAYDQAIVKKVEKITEDTQKLFVKLENGTEQSDPSSFKDSYDSLEAQAKTLSLMVAKRPDPQSLTSAPFLSEQSVTLPTDIAQELGIDSNIPGSTDCNLKNFTSGLMCNYILTIKKMEKKEISDGLSSFEVELYWAYIDDILINLLHYEGTVLNRNR
ncbi:MAG: hypothetical protein ACPGOY_07960 [Rhodospirillaceae bacterium]